MRQCLKQWHLLHFIILDFFRGGDHHFLHEMVFAGRESSNIAKMAGRPKRITVGGELLGGLTMFGIY